MWPYGQDRGPNSAGGDGSCGGGPDITVPDVVGALRGLRTWRMDDDGYLRGVTYPERWDPGVNTARCLAIWTKTRQGEDLVVPTTTVGSNPPFDIDENGKIRPLPGYHAGYKCPGVATGNHGCGFYSKHGRAGMTVGYNGVVYGVIEVWGQIELGPSGMRAEKAKIVALVRPRVLDEQVRKAIDMRGTALAALNSLPEIPLWVYPFLALPSVRQVWRERRHDVRRALRAIAECDKAIEAHSKRLAWFDHERHPIYDVPVFATVEGLLDAFPVPDLTYLAEPNDEQKPDDS